MQKVNEQPLETYEHWIDSGRIIIPCLKGRPIVKNWQAPSFKISKEEWKNKYTHCAMGLRLDQDIDFDIDNELAKRFIEKYASSSSAISGRPTNPTSHYWWKGELTNKKFTLPKEFKTYYEKFPHGATLCEIRNGPSQYTIVPKSRHSKNDEDVVWEKYEGIKEYPGDLNTDLRKVALSTALCILYADQGQRDDYCTAIAGVLLKNTKWTEEEVNEFVYNLAVESDDNEAEDRATKGTSGKKAQRNFGIPKLAEIMGCTTKTVSELFSWIGIGYETIEDTNIIGNIIEYGEDRYFVEIKRIIDGKPEIKQITVRGGELKQKPFGDAVMKQAQIWLIKIKDNVFNDMMRKKFNARTQSEDYVEEAAEDMVFIKHFQQYIHKEQAYTDSAALLEYKRPHFHLKKRYLEFNLNSFEDFLVDKRVGSERVDLVLNIQRILKAKKIRGRIKEKSCVRWRIDEYDIPHDDLIIEGEATEMKEITDDKA
jgi:hypothetical protein|tara:strand:- start:551 stop:1996 length:1446 start_codon:yes stop_codon:yes gene_type:complete